jgi:hypothetical protein
VQDNHRSGTIDYHLRVHKRIFDHTEHTEIAKIYELKLYIFVLKHNEEYIFQKWQLIRQREKFDRAIT